MKTRLIVTLGLPFFVLSACSDDGNAGDEVGESATESSETDAGTESSETDAGTESGESDAGTESGESDSGTESGETESDSGTESSESDTQSEESSESDTDEGSSETGTDTGSEGDLCSDDDRSPYAGPLCGSEGQPCVVVADHELDGPTFRNGSPGIALGADCRPHVIFSRSGFVGAYAVNDGFGWEIEETPFPIARGAVAVGSDTQLPTVVANDGSWDVSAWVRDGSWQQVHSFEGEHIFHDGLVRDAMGTLHVALRTDAQELRYASSDGGDWILSEFSDEAQAPALAASIAGRPHIIGWATGPNGWTVNWRTDQDPVEVAANLGSGGLSSIPLAITVVGGDALDPGTPHLLHSLDASDFFEFKTSLAYTVREGPGQWSSQVIAEDSTSAECSFQPSETGDTCDYDYVRHHPLAIVSSEGGDVRIFWSRIHHMGTRVGECIEGAPLGGCSWNRLEDASTGTLTMGVVDEGEVSAVALTDSFATSGVAVVDAGGRMHLAVYDFEPDDPDGVSVHYLRLAP